VRLNNNNKTDSSHIKWNFTCTTWHLYQSRGGVEKQVWYRGMEVTRMLLLGFT